MKNLTRIILLFCLFCSTSATYGTTLTGKLFDSVSQSSVGKGGYVFALSSMNQSGTASDFPNIICYTKIDNPSGEWAMWWLPDSGSILLIGFHPNVMSNLVKMEVTLNGGYQDLGYVKTSMATYSGNLLHRYLGHLVNQKNYSIAEFLLEKVRGRENGQEGDRRTLYNKMNNVMDLAGQKHKLSQHPGLGNIRIGTCYLYQSYALDADTINSLEERFFIPELSGQKPVEVYTETIENIRQIGSWTLVYLRRSYEEWNPKEYHLRNYAPKTRILAYNYPIMRRLNDKKSIQHESDITNPDMQYDPNTEYGHVINIRSPDLISVMDELDGGVVPQRVLSVKIKNKTYDSCIIEKRYGHKGHYLYINVYHFPEYEIIKVEGHWIDGGKITFLENIDTEFMNPPSGLKQKEDHRPIQEPNPDLEFIKTPPRESKAGDKIEFEWVSDSTGDEFRYKLDMPGDWKGGIKYNLNKWSEWGNQRKLFLSDFTLDGKYKLTVEARREWRKENIARIEYEFEIFNVMPEIYEEAVNINWNRVQAEEELSRKFLILSEEYGQARAMWEEVYERERKVHDLTWSSQDLRNVVGELVAMEGSLLILKEGLSKLAMASVKKLLLPKTIYDILKQTGVDLMLIASNIRTNRAAFSAIRAGWAEAGYKKLWKMTEEGAGDTSFLADVNGPGDANSNPTSSLIEANESSAQHTLRQIIEAQKIYVLSNGVYARDLETLIQADLLNYSLASGAAAGYRFAVIGQRESFVVTAVPIEPGQSGEKSFYCDQSGIIRFEDNGSASEYSQTVN